MKELNKSYIFKQQHRGIHYKIVKWFYESDKDEQKPKWNYYIFLHLDHFEDQELAKKFWPKDKKWSYGKGRYYTPYDKVPVIHSIDFHCGVTYFNKIVNSGNKKTLEIGCDYSHLYDEGCHYNEFNLQYDAENTIELFHKLVKYKVWCNGNGKLYTEDQGEYKENGLFYSNEWTNKDLTKDENRVS